jgi:hypothetical protein
VTGARASLRRRPGAARGDGGSAVVEVLVLGVLLLVPLVYLVVVVGRVQAAAFAAEGGAREAARVVAQPVDGDAAGAARDARAVVALAAEDQGFAAGDARLEVVCEASPCATPDALVRTVVRLDVVLPGVPRVLTAVVPSSVRVEARGSAAADRFAAAEGP